MKSLYRNNDGERGVSPVIGVILMVAITVILAAVIAAFVLDMGTGTSQSATAGIDISESGDEVTIRYIDGGNVDGLYVQVDKVGTDDSYWIDSDGANAQTDRDNRGGNEWSVGDSLTIDTDSPGQLDQFDDSDEVESIVVIGELDGEDTVITSW